MSFPEVKEKSLVINKSVLNKSDSKNKYNSLPLSISKKFGASSQSNVTSSVQISPAINYKSPFLNEKLIDSVCKPDIIK